MSLPLTLNPYPLAPVGAAMKRCPQVIAQPFHLISRTFKKRKKKSPQSGFHRGTSEMVGKVFPHKKISTFRQKKKVLPQS